MALARRPRGAAGHGDEEVVARLLEDDATCWRWRTPASPPSTTAAAVSAAPGSSCGWPGRSIRGAAPGQVLAGSSLDLEGVQVHVAIFRWRLDGREATGAYELMVRTDPPAAA